MPAPPPAIRTPDQRLRVFVSSTLKELASERRAVRTAIEGLRLAPVMFELGARPHPPRELYRAYLDQSDVFVGIYAERYGWVAPGEEVSGLEDEYRLSADLPLLVYIREPAPDRDDRLTALLDRIRDDDRTSYRTFTTSGELASLVSDDLATLLADRFEQSRPPSPPDLADEPSSSLPIPVAFAGLVGREREKRRVEVLLDDRTIRMVTLVGPGGVGKSRLAIEIAADSAARGADVAFASLESLTTPDQVIPVIARAVGVRDTGEAPIRGKLVSALAGRDLLLIVDNMEHLLDAAGDLVALLAEAPRLKLLVTSRSPLRVRPERVVEIGPLDVPEAEAGVGEASLSAAVELFVDRARVVRPDFALTPENAAVVTGIVRALDGMPLAIELAAARLRVLGPTELLERLDSALSLLVSGGRDLPTRQRALRSTIEWSTRMLAEREHDAFAQLAVFAGPFTIEAAERVLGADAVQTLEVLLEAGLLRHLERTGVELFAMLSLVRAYAQELLDQDSRAADRSRERWIDYYASFASAAEKGMESTEQFPWLNRADAESENLIGVMRFLLSQHRLADAAEFAWSLYLLGWIGGLLGLLRSWGVEILRVAHSTGTPLPARAEAIALYYANAIRFWEDPEAVVLPGLRRAAELFDSADDPNSVALTRVSLALALLAGNSSNVPAARAELESALAGFASTSDRWGMAMTLVALGRVDLVAGDVASAGSRFAESLDLATASDERLGISIAQTHLAWTILLSGDVDGARALFAEELDTAVRMGHVESIAYGLEGFVGVAAAEGDAERAGVLAGAAGDQRRRSGLVNPSFLLHDHALARLREAGEADAVEQGMRRGVEIPITEATALALGRRNP